MENGQGRITELLNLAAAGDARAREELSKLVYDELKRIAARVFASERAGHTLQATAIANDAYLALVGRSDAWEGRSQFFAMAAPAMRRILTDHARRRLARKRGGGRERITMESGVLEAAAPAVDPVALDEALCGLERIEPRYARIFECRYFGGLGNAETADALGMALRTVEQDWAFVRAWMRRALDETLRS